MFVLINANPKTVWEAKVANYTGRFASTLASIDDVNEAIARAKALLVERSDLHRVEIYERIGGEVLPETATYALHHTVYWDTTLHQILHCAHHAALSVPANHRMGAAA